MKNLIAIVALAITSAATADVTIHSWEKWYETANSVRYFGQEYVTARTNVDNGRVFLEDRGDYSRLRLFNQTKPNAIVGGEAVVTWDERIYVTQIKDQLPEGATVLLRGRGLLEPINLREVEVGAWIKRGCYTIEYQGFEPGDKFVIDVTETAP